MTKIQEILAFRHPTVPSSIKKNCTASFMVKSITRKFFYTLSNFDNFRGRKGVATSPSTTRCKVNFTKKRFMTHKVEASRSKMRPSGSSCDLFFSTKWHQSKSSTIFHCHRYSCALRCAWWIFIKRNFTHPIGRICETGAQNVRRYRSSHN